MEEYQSDPIDDPGFMAFLSSYSPTSAQLQQPQPTETVSNTVIATTTSTSTSKKKYTKRNSTSNPNRIGRCEHPKHVIYRQEKYTLLKPSVSADEKSVLKALPRRGRPPKGSKSVEFETIQYPIVELTVRPLPKRLENVVGKSSIKVCLTCLKRSDTDPEYITNEKYIGPQKK